MLGANLLREMMKPSRNSDFFMNQSCARVLSIFSSLSHIDLVCNSKMDSCCLICFSFPFVQSCRCSDDCSSMYCVCGRNSVKCWYDKVRNNCYETEQEKSGANRASIILFLHQREGCLLQTYSIFLWIFLFDVFNDIKIIF